MKRYGLPISVGLLVATLGCSDGVIVEPLVAPAASSPAISIPWDGMDAPNFTSLDDVPFEFRFARATRLGHGITWSGQEAHGYGWMSYAGNRAEIAHTTTILRGFEEVSRVPQTYKRGHFQPTSNGNHDAAHSVRTASVCGQVANLHTVFTARAVAFINWGFTQVGRDDDYGWSTADQPPCATCRPDPAAVMSISYDPYAQGNSDGDCGSGSGGGSNDSNCRHEYIVIEVFNESTGQWEAWWSGWATVCE